MITKKRTSILDDKSSATTPLKRVKREEGGVSFSSGKKGDVGKGEIGTPTGTSPAAMLRLFRSMADKVASKSLKSGEIKDILERCCANVSVILRDEKVLEALLNSPWTSLDSENFDFAQYENFLLTILVADTSNLELALNVWIQCILDEDRSWVHDRVHRLIAGMNAWFPSTQEKAVQALHRSLAIIKKQTGKILARFTLHLLRMASYMPKVAKNLMDLVIKSVAAIDVRVPEAVIAEFCQESDENGNDEEMEDEETAALRSKAMGLDESTEILIKELLRRLRVARTNTEPSSSSNSAPLKDEKAVIQQLLSVSGSVFLSCETTTHLQYALFVLCGASEPCAQYFLDWLWEVTRNPRSLPVVRETALGYLASFLCRARFLTTKQKQGVVDVMCKWALAYIHQGPHSSSMDFKAHLPFFATCQAIFYVIAFNHKQFMRKKTGLTWAKHLALEKIVGCSLNPLKYCQPDVVKNFANVARHYQIVYCYSIIERNRRSVLPELEWTSNGELRPVARAHLSPIFPFDKPVMPRVRRVVEPFYVEYDKSDDIPAAPSTEEVVSLKSDEFCANEEQHFHRERRDTGGSVGVETFDYSTSPGFVHW